MASRDYVLCKDCGCKTIPDGYDNARNYFEEKWGDPEATGWTLKFIRCPVCTAKLEAENTRLQDELNIITTAFPGLRQRPPGMPGDTLLDYITKAEQAKKYVTALEAEIKLLENEQ